MLLPVGMAELRQAFGSLCMCSRSSAQRKHLFLGTQASPHLCTPTQDGHSLWHSQLAGAGQGKQAEEDGAIADVKALCGR